MKSKKVALVYHVNLNHASLSPELREIFLEECLPKLLKSMVVPANISICAEDLLLLRSFYPKTFSIIVRNPHIKLLINTFSHILLERHPEMEVKQLQLAWRIMRHLLPQNKLLSFCYPPEVALPGARARRYLKSQGGVIVGESRLDIPPELPDFFNIDGLAVAISRREVAYRHTFHEFLREAASVQDVMGAINSDFKTRSKQSKNQPLVLRIDMETPIFNRVHFEDGTVSPGRTDLFAKLQKAFAALNDMQFVFLDEKCIKYAQATACSIKNVSPNPSEDPKWDRADLNMILSSYVRQTTNLSPLILSAACSDYFCINARQQMLPAKYKGKAGKVVIQRKRSFRNPELRAKLKLLNGEKRLGRGKSYIHKMGVVFENVNQLTNSYSK